jgi:Domain of unknown function (DUF4351)/Putative transposase, YhgA-like
MTRPYQWQDTAWKEVMGAFFKEFVALCLPSLYPLVDWTRPWISLDKELHTITNDGAIGKRYVDKLFKIYLKDGQERWVLVHLEIQAEPDEAFPERMFIYAYRIYDKYQQTVFSCAILADFKADWRPNHYEVALADSRLRLDFSIVKLLDYKEQIDLLEASSNPFASVILSHLAAQQVKRKPNEVRLQTKLNLTRRLYKKGFSKEQILKLYLFIDWSLHLPEDLEIEYKDVVYQLEAEQKMAYISSIENFGIQKGIQKGGHDLLLKQLERKFHTIPNRYRQALSEADAERLLLLGERVLEATTLEDIFKN